MFFTRFFHFPAIVAGFVTVLVGYTSSAVIIFQAAQAAGADAAQTGSWMMALGVGMGVTTFGLSLKYKMPIITAWSTPGAALLATSLPGFTIAEAVGAFLFSALLITICGLSGWFERIIDRIPLPIAAAMLAGILFQFGINLFVAMETALLMVSIMFAVYLLAKQWIPRYAILAVLAVGLIVIGMQGLLDFSGFDFTLGAPQWVNPEFSVSALIGVGIPLFVVTMVSQNIPGVAVLRASGYHAPISSIISWTGISTLILAPFGGFALNLAAITAAICTGPEAHHDAEKRYLAGLSAGVFYLIIGFFGSAVAALFAVFPVEFVLALAGLALISTIANSLQLATAEATTREAAVLTFLVSASGVNLFGIGAAFWGLVAGVIAMLTMRLFNRG